MLLIVLLLLIMTISTVITEHKNGISEEPRVFCGPEGIHVLVRTRTLFRGRLFVQEESERPECMHSYVNGIDDEVKRPTDNSAEFHLKFGTCNMRRQRTLSPRGVTFSFTLVVSFHSLFLTASDHAFNVRCFFVEAVKAVDTALDVSPMTTKVIEQEFPLPRCNYNIRSEHGAPALRYANVGDAVTHVWECDPSAGWVYGVLIHSCYVDNGRGNRFELINSRGCAVDHLLLGDLNYDEHRLSAYVNSRVFKYADRIQLFFTCTVQLCFRQDGGCDGITPPKCNGHNSLSHHTHKLQSKILPPTYVQRPRSHPNGPSPIDIFRQIARNRVFRPRDDFKSSSHELDLRYDRLLKDDALVAVVNETEQQQVLLQTDDIDDTKNFTITSVEATKRSGRDAISAMETDLSAQLRVMPLENYDSEGEENNEFLRKSDKSVLYKNLAAPIGSRCLKPVPTTAFCFNKISIFSLLLVLFIGALIIVLLITCLMIRRQRRALARHHQNRSMPRKIFLTK